jgi:ankyrin repeat protein
MTPLMWAPLTETYDHTGHAGAAALNREERRRAVAMEIIKNGANVNAVCFIPKWKNWTPLLFATLDPDRNASVIAALVDGGANVNARTDDDLTPLIHASAYGRSPDAVHKLITAGADVNAAGEQDGREGWTPLMYALNSPFKSFHIIRELVLGDADVNITLPGCSAPLFFALNICGDDPAYVELLLNAGADVRALDSDGNSLFDCALAKNYKRVARLLSKAAQADAAKGRN